MIVHRQSRLRPLTTGVFLLSGLPDDAPLDRRAVQIFQIRLPLYPIPNKARHRIGEADEGITFVTQPPDFVYQQKVSPWAIQQATAIVGQPLAYFTPSTANHSALLQRSQPAPRVYC